MCEPFKLKWFKIEPGHPWKIIFMKVRRFVMVHYDYNFFPLVPVLSFKMIQNKF